MQLSAVLGHPDQPHFPHSPPPPHHAPAPPVNKKKCLSQLRRQERRKREAKANADEATSELHNIDNIGEKTSYS